MKKGKCFQSSFGQFVVRLTVSAGLLLLLHPFLLKGIFQELAHCNDFRTLSTYVQTLEGNVPAEQEMNLAANKEEASENPASFFTDYFTGSAANPAFCQPFQLRYRVQKGDPFLLSRNKCILTPPPEC